MKRIPTKDAIAHFGRAGDAYGGRAALAAELGISSQAIGRWSGPFVPENHAKKLLDKHAAMHQLAIEVEPVPTTRRKRTTRKPTE